MLRIAVIASVAVLAAVGAAQGVVRFSADQLAQRAPAPVAASAVVTPSSASKDASISKGPDGHFWAEAQVNSSAVHFLVDTGATAVSLSPEDARRLGFNPSDLTYGYKVTTANGPARAARVTLASISVAGARVENVEAYVIESGLDTSLLGMSFLGRLSSFEATRSSLILHS